MALFSKSKTPDDSFELYKRLIRTYLFRYRRILAVAGVGMVLVAVTTAANAYLMQPILDHIFVNKNASLLMILPLGVIALAIINAAGDYAQSLSLRYVGQRVVSDMQLDLFSHLIHADIALFNDQSSGRLVSRLTNDIMLMRQSVSQVFTGLLKETLSMIFLIGVMLYQSWQMSLLALVILVVAILPISKLGRRMRKIADATQVQLGDFTGQLDATFQGVRVVKAYGAEAYEIERARLTIRQLFKLYYKAARVQSAAAPIVSMVGTMAIATVLWYGGFNVIHGSTTPGAFFSFITAMIMAYRPLKTVAGLTTQLHEGMAAAKRFFSVIDQPAVIHDAENAVPLVVSDGEVRFNAVNFTYATGKGGVQNLSFEVPRNSTVALVGSSGAGKSTIMNLLLRFYETQSGSITIDGQDIRNVTLASLRGAFALVSQDIVLFDDTVRANIAYGTPNATDAEIMAAAEKAYAHEFISQLPEGYDTPIGPSGVKLSGGQRQRLSIARAILKNAPILLLDEATSALDTASERAVQAALEALMQGRTTLVIAHRLSTIQHANRILVLDGGRIVDAGTHDELLQHSAHYQQLNQLASGGVLASA
jgi:subfamily B ATP-binding cassette protein MsbA